MPSCPEVIFARMPFLGLIICLRSVSDNDLNLLFPDKLPCLALGQQPYQRMDTQALEGWLRHVESLQTLPECSRHSHGAGVTVGSSILHRSVHLALPSSVTHDARDCL